MTGMARALLAMLGGVVACGAPPAPGSAAPAEAQAPEGQKPQIPAGLGTLRMDDVTMTLRTGPLLIKVTPLDEGIIRLLAPDTYERMHSLAASRRAEAEASTSGRVPELFLASFFSYEPNVEFQPEDLQISHQGRLMRAVAILPVTAGFGRQRLAQQENQSAIYVFDEEMNYDLRIVVSYGPAETDVWTRIIPRLEVERAKVRAKAGAGPAGPAVRSGPGPYRPLTPSPAITTGSRTP